MASIRTHRNRDPTRTGKVYKRKLIVERKLTEWVIENKHMLIAGHTHKAEHPAAGLPPYFNSGCCVGKSGITAIEIDEGYISLVKWYYSKDYINKDILAGPVSIGEYLLE